MALVRNEPKLGARSLGQFLSIAEAEKAILLTVDDERRTTGRPLSSHFQWIHFARPYSNPGSSEPDDWAEEDVAAREILFEPGVAGVVEPGEGRVAYDRAHAGFIGGEPGGGSAERATDEDGLFGFEGADGLTNEFGLSGTESDGFGGVVVLAGHGENDDLVAAFLKFDAGIGVVAAISAEAVAQDEDGFSFAFGDRRSNPRIDALDRLPDGKLWWLLRLGSRHVDQAVGELVAHAEVESNPEGEPEDHFTKPIFPPL